MEANAKREKPRLQSTGEIVQLPVLLTISDVARHLGVKERHIRRLIAERRIPFVKWGHLIRFDPEEVLEWLAQHQRGAEEA